MPIPASQLMNLFGGLGSALGAGYAGIRDGGAAAVPGLRMAVGDAGNFLQQIQADEERKRQLAAAGQVDALMQGAGMPQGLAQAATAANINVPGLYGAINTQNKTEEYSAQKEADRELRKQLKEQTELAKKAQEDATVAAIRLQFKDVTEEQARAMAQGKSFVGAAIIQDKNAAATAQTKEIKEAEKRRELVDAISRQYGMPPNAASDAVTIFESKAKGLVAAFQKEKDQKAKDAAAALFVENDPRTAAMPLARRNAIANAIADDLYRMGPEKVDVNAELMLKLIDKMK